MRECPICWKYLRLHTSARALDCALREYRVDSVEALARVLVPVEQPKARP